MEQVSLEARRGLHNYGDHLSQYFESAEQSERIGDNLRVFVDEKLMSDRAVDVAMLQGYVDTIRDESVPREERRVIACQVMDYLTDSQSPTNAKDVDYMFALWGDLPKIDAVANNYRDRLESHGTEQSQAVIDKLDGKAEIAEDDWHTIRIGVDVPKIVELSQHVNVESILARSSLVLDRVATATTYDGAVLKDILEIETVYAPLLDLLGLHACEAILKHHSEKARLMATGREDVVDAYNEASAYIESVREDGLVNNVISDVMGIDLEEYDFGFIIDNEETPYGSKSYFSAIRFKDVNGIAARFISRIKSPASYAHKKRHNYKGEEPQDVYAGTLVVESIEEMVSMFKDVHANIQRLDSCELSVATSKEHSIHVKGKAAYIEAVENYLGEDFGGQLDVGIVGAAIEEPFQVLKVTFTVRDGDAILPVEIQFQTIEDRKRSRLGGASHLCFKGMNGNGLPGNVPGKSADLWKANNRKWAMLEGGEEIYYDLGPNAEELQSQRVQALKEIFMGTLKDSYTTM